MAKLKKTILVVDDDQDARGLLRHILDLEGFEVLEASDGLEALKCLKKQVVDLIITDRSMPHMDGMALLGKLHEQYPSLPVLMLSAYGEESFWGQAISQGARDYLLKPFKADEVLAQIRKNLSETPDV